MRRQPTLNDGSNVNKKHHLLFLSKDLARRARIVRDRITPSLRGQQLDQSWSRTQFFIAELALKTAMDITLQCTCSKRSHEVDSARLIDDRT
jgi:hypothetical protein